MVVGIAGCGDVDIVETPVGDERRCGLGVGERSGSDRRGEYPVGTKISGAEQRRPGLIGSVEADL